MTPVMAASSEMTALQLQWTTEELVVLLGLPNTQLREKGRRWPRHASVSVGNGPFPFSALKIDLAKKATHDT